MKNHLLTIDQVAAYLQVHPKTIYKFIRKREFPHGMKRWNCRRWHQTEIDEWLNSEEKVAESNPA
jgi:excisionase family DNA binding protein|tara:strand:+ start:12931 stop:13125 length:195 start_codon:yes stop_codon:yes gene_type:complete